VSAAEPFVVVGEIHEVDPNAPVLVAYSVPGNVHRAVGYINEHLPDFIPGLIQIEFVGTHTSVAVFRTTNAQVEKAKREGRW